MYHRTTAPVWGNTFSKAIYSPLKVLTRFLLRSIIFNTPVSRSISPISPVLIHPSSVNVSAVSCGRFKYPLVILGPRKRISPCGLGREEARYDIEGTETSLSSMLVPMGPVPLVTFQSGFERAPILRTQG